MEGQAGQAVATSSHQESRTQTPLRSGSGIRIWVSASSRDEETVEGRGAGPPLLRPLPAMMNAECIASRMDSRAVCGGVVDGCGSPPTSSLEPGFATFDRR